MNLLDMRTVMFSYVISSIICAAVMALLWRQNRRRTPEVGFWLADFGMQFIGLLLAGVLRGILPDFYSMVLSNMLIIGGTVLLFIGLERYNGKAGPQWYNYLYLVVFVLVQMFFVYVQPSLFARNLNISLGLLLICAQCAWLLLHRVGPAMRPDTRTAGVVFTILSLVSLVRIFVDLAAPPGNDFFKSGLYDSLLILIYQMLYIWLTFTLFLMVDRRLLTTLEKDISARKLVEATLKVSEEKFHIAFHNIPEAIVITSLPDGKIIEANASFFRISEYGIAESIGKTTVELDLWGSLAHRNDMVAALQKQGRVQNLETEFRKKSGKLFSGSISGELIELQGQKCVLNVIHDLTDRKRLEEEIRNLSLTDELTGLYNRRGFTLLAEQEVKLAYRKKRTMLLFYGDMDDLKTINDTQGHAQGDLALKAVSAILKDNFREADIVARIGGDEFVALALDASTESSEILSNRIRTALEARNHARAETCHLSLSMGFAHYDPEHPCTVSELIAQADAMMYHQKQARK